MFEVDGVQFDLLFNKTAIKSVEMQTGQGVAASIVSNKGVLGFQLLESLFVAGLVDAKTKEKINQKEAVEHFDKLTEKNGLMTINMAIVEKLQTDMGFMFR